MMSKNKKKRKKYTYPRQNKSKFARSITISQYQDIFVSYEKGRIHIPDKNGKVFDFGPETMTRSYKGANKEHIVAKATNLRNLTGEVGSWVECFDYIFAIDTNTHLQKCNDFYCSVGAVFYGKVQKESEYGGNIICIPCLTIDWYHPCKTKIELISWVETIKYLEKIIPSSQKVGVVVDSELENLEEYNNRTLPILEQWYLPENYSLIYATADSSDEWCNKMIRECDKFASKRLREVVAEPKLKTNCPGGVAPIGFFTFYETENYSNPAYPPR